MEEKLKVGSAKDAWRWLNIMIGRENKEQTIKTDNPRGFANGLNRFYARFDVTDFSREHDNVCRSLIPSPVCVEEEAMKCARVRACVYARVSGCTPVLNFTSCVCAGVCLGRKPGACERGGECESETKIILDVFIYLF